MPQSSDPAAVTLTGHRPSLGKSAFIRSKPIGALLAGRVAKYSVTNLDNLVRNARPSRRRRIFQMSALSNFVGR